MSPKVSGSQIKLSQPTLGVEEQAAAVGVLRSGRLVQGPQVEAFEQEFAEATGSRHAVAVSSGTAALVLALRALDVRAGDEVIVPAYTFIATANAVRLAGAKVVLADILPDSMNLDPASLKAACGERTTTVIPVHQFGLPADLDGISRAAQELQMVEDAACAVGSAGAPKGLMACFSFHQRKVITTGEGGMLTTEDGRLVEKLRALRQHGDMQELIGYNFRMPEICAAIGRVQLKRLPDLLISRRRAAAAYRDGLSGVGWLELPPDSDMHTYQSYVVRLRDNAPLTRQDLLEQLRSRAVECQAGVEPVHRHAAYLDSVRVPLPVSESAGALALFLPMHAELTDQDVEEVCSAIKEAESR